MDKTEAITRPVEDEIDHEVIEDESSSFAQLVPKEEDGIVEEVEEISHSRPDVGSARRCFKQTCPAAVTHPFRRTIFSENRFPLFGIVR